MRRSLFGLALLLALTVPAVAQDYRIVGFEQITVAAVSIGFTSTAINPSTGPQATVATCTLETGDIRYRLDGTAPTSSVGMYWTAATGPLSFSSNAILNQFRAIRVSGTSGLLSCSYSTTQ